MRLAKLATVIAVTGAMLLPTMGLARWHTANDTAINPRRVCKNGAKITIADYPYDPETETPPTDLEFSYDLVVTSPPFIPDPTSEPPVPQAPPESVVFRGDLALRYRPINFKLAGDSTTLYYAYSKPFKILWSRKLRPGSRVGFDLFPDSVDDVITTVRVADCSVST